MKTKFLSLFACLIFCSALAFGQEQQVEKKETITFNEITHDFGNVPQDGGNVSCTFEFTNNGKTPIVLTKVTSSCGCTTPEWTKEPVAPGQKGKIVATYLVSGAGPFHKSLTVSSNGEPNNMVLFIKGVVEAKK